MYTMMQRRSKLNECGRRWFVLYSHTFRQAKMFPNKIRDIFVVETMFPYLDSQKRTSCSRSAAGLLPCCHQIDIRIRSHRSLAPAWWQQVCCKLSTRFLLSTAQVSCKLFQQQPASSLKYQVATSCIDLPQFDEFNRLAATRWKLACSKLVKSATCRTFVAFLAV